MVVVGTRFVIFRAKILAMRARESCEQKIRRPIDHGEKIVHLSPLREVFRPLFNECLLSLVTTR